MLSVFSMFGITFKSSRINSATTKASRCMFGYTVKNHSGHKQFSLAFVAVHRDFGSTVVFCCVSKHARGAASPFKVKIYRVSKHSHYSCFCTLSTTKEIMGVEDSVSFVVFADITFQTWFSHCYVMDVLCWHLSSFLDCRHNLRTIPVLTRGCLMHFGKHFSAKALEVSTKESFQIYSKLCLLPALLIWSMKIWKRI